MVLMNLFEGKECRQKRGKWAGRQSRGRRGWDTLSK